MSLSPRSTRSYLRTSLRCKQESARYISDLDWFLFDYVKNLSFIFCFHHFLMQYSNGFLFDLNDQECCFLEISSGKVSSSHRRSLSLSLKHTHIEQIGEMGFHLSTQTPFGWLENWGKGKENICFYLGPICNRISFSWFSNNESEIQIWLSFICYFYKPK